MNTQPKSLPDAKDIAKGFDPHEEIHDFYGCFTLKQAQRSLFKSTRFKHKVVHLTDDDEGVRLPVVIDLAQARFHDGIHDVEMPDWYFEGWILDPGNPGIQRVRIYVSTMDYSKELSDDDTFRWQMIVDHADLPLDASILKLGLRGRSNTLLGIRGIETVKDVIEFARRHEFIEILGFGPGLQADLYAKMEAAGHKLP